MSGNYNWNNYIGKYNTKEDYSYLFSNMTQKSTRGSISLADYASIKNGSYGKLLKAYYSKEDAEKLSGTGDSANQLAAVRANASSLQESADALNNDSLWEKKKIISKDEKTGEEIVTEDYDWEAITKALNNFIGDYNGVVEEAGNSNTKGVLRHAVWMTGMTKQTENLLSKAGITRGKGSKLELDEEALKKADIETLKFLFTGQGSFADKVSYKAYNIMNAAVPSGGTYNREGNYMKSFSELISSKVDKEV